jgi:hypothetical protein
MLRAKPASGGVVHAVEEFLLALPSLDGEQVRWRLQELVPEYRPAGLPAREGTRVQ